MSEICKILEEVAAEICDKYCKYPNEPVPEGETKDWLIDSEKSPCNDCPLNRII